MIGRLRSVVVDCPDPQGLAGFWAEVLGGAVTDEEPDWVVVTDPSGRRLAFQLSADPPRGRRRPTRHPHSASAAASTATITADCCPADSSDHFLSKSPGPTVGALCSIFR